MPRLQRATKNIILLATVLVLSAVIGASQKRAAATGRPFLPEQIIQAVISPFERGLYWICTPVRTVKRSLRTRRRLQTENKRLRADVLRLTEENAHLTELASESARLREAVGFSESRPERMRLARVIAAQASRRFDTCTLDLGGNDGVVRECAVITPRGLVGRVFETTPNTSQVLLLTDATSAVGAMLSRSRATGICEGQQSNTLILKYLQRDADAHVGDVVVSSGMGGVYPKGLVIGRVVRIISKPGDFLKSAEVAPSVKFDTLEEAFVILKGPT